MIDSIWLPKYFSKLFLDNFCSCLSWSHRPDHLDRLYVFKVPNEWRPDITWVGEYDEWSNASPLNYNNYSRAQRPVEFALKEPKNKLA